MLKLERHRLGPRIYVCGIRVHEVAFGLAVLGVLAIGGVVDVWGLTHGTELTGVFGSWLVAKDWRDLFPSRRNTASWSLLPHRVPKD